jgi:lysozyme family protein
MKGIIQKEYDAYRRKRGLQTQTVRNISEDELRDIYRSSYWMPVRADELPPGLDLATNDFGINSGPVTAIRKLQQCLGIVADGHMGTQTIDAVHQSGDVHGLIAKYMDARRAYLRSLSTFQYFGRGWMSRCDGIEHAAMASAGNIIAFVPPADLPKPNPDPDLQAASQGRAPAQNPAPPLATQAGLTLGGSGGLVAAGPGIVARYTASGKFTLSGLVLAALQEPLVWVGALALFGAVTTWLWRRKHV